MKRILTALMCMAVSLGTFAQVKLTIRPDMIIDEKAYPMSSPARMFDEQSTIAAEPPTTKPQTYWGDYISKDLFYPLSAVVDLGREITISNIYIYDLNGSSRVSFYAKIGSAWQLLFEDGLTNWDVWNKHVINKKTRYIRIVSASPDGRFPEVVMYGDQATLPPTYPIATAKDYAPMEDFLGLNILHINPIERASIVKNIRQFHMWAWNEADLNIAGYPGFPNNQYSFNPSANMSWDFDQVYQSYKNKGLRLTPTAQGSAFWLLNTTVEELAENKPVLIGEDSENPATYAEHADYMYQFAARYGSTKVPLGNLKLKSNNPVATGLGTIDALENWNEPNKTWKGRAGLFTPYEYAAMTSADYDGHQGALGTKAGVKNADPNLPMAMAGLISLDTTYTKAMLFWFKQNRTDGKIPMDILNYHHYSNDAGGQTGAPSFGISPEQDNLEKKVKDLVTFCKRNAPNKPIWISEFGYDVSQASAQRAKTYGSFNGEDVQAMWLIRSFMAIYAGGADRAYMFWLSDDDSESPYQFGTCGLLSQYPPAVAQPRKSYYWLATLNNVLGKYKLQDKTVSGNVHIAKFNSPISQDTTIYCVWQGTSNGTTTANFSIPVGGSKAMLITPQVGSLNGVHAPLAITGGSVKVNVTENPVYIKVYGSAGSVLALGEEELTTSEIEVYPNPTQGNTFLNIPKNVKVERVTILDARGSVVKTYQNLVSNVVELGTDNLENGIYSIQITQKDVLQPVTKKLVVVR